MNAFLKKVAMVYITINKKINHFLEKVISKELEKEKRRFLAKNQFEPNEREVQELKKELVMKKTLPYLLFLVFTFMLIIILFL